MPPVQVSKATFKAHALEIFRRVEATGEPVVITDRGRPVLRLEPYFGEDEGELAGLLGSVRAYTDPTEPIADAGWEALG